MRFGSIRINQAMFSGVTHINSLGSGKEVVNVDISSGGDASKSGVDSDKPARNKPIEPKKPPFFLPSIQSLSGEVVVSMTIEAFTDYLKTLSSSTLDAELRMLQIFDDDDGQEPKKRPQLIILQLLLDYFMHEISHRKNFDCIQALIRLFLEVLGNTLVCLFWRNTHRRTSDGSRSSLGFGNGEKSDEEGEVMIAEVFCNSGIRNRSMIQL
ncbi:hypothetical protein R6Q57_018495 [Mikania cordata]